MEAGRALDAEVAEKVMGCNVFRRIIPVGTPVVVREPHRAPSVLQDEITTYSCQCTPVHVHNDDSGQLPPYSTDIAAAFLVVERLREKHWNFTLNCHHDRWSVLLDDETYGSEIFGDAAPHAISLAALKAVGAL